MEKLLLSKKISGSFDILKNYSAGIKLLGEEVKSLRQGKGNLKGAFAKNIGGQIFLVGFNIPKYSRSSNLKYDPTRSRKLLLTKKEIIDINAQISSKGRTLIPLEVFINESKLVKVKLGLAKGVGKAGKRQFEKEKQLKKDMDKEIKEVRTR